MTYIITYKFDTNLDDFNFLSLKYPERRLFRYNQLFLI